MQINNAPYDKVAGVFLNLPLFRPKSSRLSRYLLFALEINKVISAQETYYPLLAKIVESCNFATEHGVQGRHFLLSEFRGDQLWFRQLFQHVSWWKSLNVCFRCRATSDPDSPLNYLLNGSENGWETTCRSTNDFLLEELPSPMCPWSIRLVSYLGSAIPFEARMWISTTSTFR